LGVVGITYYKLEIEKLRRQLTARMLGIMLPLTLLSIADDVIE
jgi:hypothetical protein